MNSGDICPSEVLADTMKKAKTNVDRMVWSVRFVIFLIFSLKAKNDVLFLLLEKRIRGRRIARRPLPVETVLSPEVDHIVH